MRSVAVQGSAAGSDLAIHHVDSWAGKVATDDGIVIQYIDAASSGRVKHTTHLERRWKGGPMKGLRITLICTLALGLLVGSAFGVAAQEEESAAAAPVEFEAQWAFGHELQFESSAGSGVDEVVRYRDGAWRPRVLLAASDPRFQGTLTLATNRDDYALVDGPQIFHGQFRVANDEGAWQQRPALSFNFPDGEAAPTVMVFDGEDGYVGLTALVSNTPDPSAGTWTLRGYIFEGDMPPAAELPTE